MGPIVLLLITHLLSSLLCKPNFQFSSSSSYSLPSFSTILKQHLLLELYPRFSQFSPDRHSSEFLFSPHFSLLNEIQVLQVPEVQQAKPNLTLQKQDCHLAQYRCYIFTNNAKNCISLSGSPITNADPFSPRLNLNNMSQTSKSHTFIWVEFHYVRVAILQVRQILLDLRISPSAKINSKSEIEN